jgi:predicted Zn-dependent protease
MLEREGKSEEAIEHYRTAIGNKPNYRFARFQLGRLLLMKKRTAEAIAQLLQTLTPEDQDTARFMYALGVAYAEAGDFASASRYLREAGQRAGSQGQDQLLGQIETSLRKVEARVEERAGR